MKRIVTIDPRIARMPFDRFARWHKISVPGDPMTAEQRYLDIGGKMPAKQVDKVKRPQE